MLNLKLSSVFSALETANCKASFLYFHKKAWEFFETSKYIHSKVTEVLCEHLQALYEGKLEHPQLIINIPPRMSKSSICCVTFQSWIWLFDPTFNFLNVANDVDLCSRDSMRMRQLLDSEWYKSINPNFDIPRGQDAKLFYKNKAGGIRQAITFRGKSTGKGCDGLIMDDPNDAGKDAHNKTSRDSINRIYDEALSNRINNPKRYFKLLIQQRVEETDLTGYLLDKMRHNGEQWEHLCLRMEYDANRPSQTSIWKDERKDGELLWAERFDYAYIETRKGVGAWYYAGQYQQDPYPLEGTLFFKSYFEKIQELPCNWEEFTNTIQMWDMALGDTGDYVACSIVGVWREQFWLLDIFKEKINFVKSIEAIKQMTAKHPITKYNIGIENKANGTAIIDTIANELPSFCVKKVGAVDNKWQRANSIVTIMSTGNFYINEAIGSDKINMFIEDMIRFKEDGTNDDLVDATVHALRELRTSNKDFYSYRL